MDTNQRFLSKVSAAETEARQVAFKKLISDV